MTFNASEGSDSFVEVFPIIEPGYLTIYEWEVVELTILRRWVGQHWKLSIYASVIYVILIYLGQSWMKNRPAYNLRTCLTFWNVILALFSLIGFARTAPELWHVLHEPYGFYTSVCTR
jgi:elongation of very long chain fatty acids protein 6